MKTTACAPGTRSELFAIRQSSLGPRLWPLALLALPCSAFAELSLTTAASTQYEHNSNVFDLPSGAPAPGVGATGQGDSYVAYGGKLAAAYLWSQQKFFANVQGDRFEYDRFSELSHSEYTLDGGWNWKAGRLLDGTLEASRVRTMVSFYNLIGSQLVLQTEKRAAAKLGLQMTPDWRTEIGGVTREVSQPQQAAPNFRLTEQSGQAALKYTGTAGVTAGLTGSYLKGDFKDTGDVLSPSYHQSFFGLTATDEVSGKSTFLGQLGYSSRTSDSDINSVKGVTGELDYRRALTGKTTAEFDLSRQINAYLTNTGSEIDTVAALRLNWQATYKIGVALGYSWTHRQLPGQGDAPFGSERVDRQNYTSLAVSYKPVTWLTLRPYAKYQDRSSENFRNGDFNSSVVGVQFTLQWQRTAEAGAIPDFAF